MWGHKAALLWRPRCGVCDAHHHTRCVHPTRFEACCVNTRQQIPQSEHPSTFTTYHIKTLRAGLLRICAGRVCACISPYAPPARPPYPHSSSSSLRVRTPTVACWRDGGPEQQQNRRGKECQHIVIWRQCARPTPDIRLKHHKHMHAKAVDGFGWHQVSKVNAHECILTNIHSGFIKSPSRVLVRNCCQQQPAFLPHSSAPLAPHASTES